MLETGNVSSIVNEVIGKFQACLFLFYEKILTAQKQVISENQLTKQN